MIVPDKYLPQVIRVLQWVWPGECGVGDRMLIIEYAGTDLARSLSWRQQIVCWFVAKYTKRMKNNSVD